MMNKTLPLILIITLLCTTLTPAQTIPQQTPQQPPTTSTLNQRNITIIRDTYGIPHIYATTKEDLAYGAGYAIAEDRLWQADLFRREATGRLAEYGIGNITTDLWIRQHGYTKTENTQLFTTMQSPYKEMITAYTDGMNHYLAEAIADPTHKLPYEYIIRGITPEPWTVEDSLAIGQLMVRRWGEGGGMEPIFTIVLALLIQQNGILNGWCIFNDACPQTDPGATCTIDNNETNLPPHINPLPPLMSNTLLAAAHHIITMDKQEQHLCEQQGLLYHFGSNGWVIAPHKSATQNPLLLGGPQMGHSIPQIVVEIGMHGAGINATGMTFPGVGPAIAIGANTHGAWTTTSGLSDGVDTYIEILHPLNQTKYRHNGTWKTMEQRIETITDHNGTTHDIICYRTIHGPVLNIQWKRFIGGIAISQKMAFWKQEHHTIEGVMSFQECTNITQFEEGVSKIVSSHNWFWADRNGDIGYYHAGYYPIRPTYGVLHRRIDDRFPLIGTGKEEWLGIVPFSELPQQRNPDKGYFANWNNKPHPTWTHAEAEVGPLFGEGHIVNRIIELLEADTSITFQDMQAICKNVAYHDAFGTFFKPFLLTAIEHHGGIPSNVTTALTSWDCYYNDENEDDYYDDPGLTIFHTWYDQLYHNVLEDELTDLAKDFAYSLLLHILQGEESKLKLRYKHYVNTTVEETIIISLQEALSILENQYNSSDVTTWLTPVDYDGFSELGSLPSPSMPSMNRGTYNQIIELPLWTNSSSLEPPIAVNVLPPGQSGFVNATGSSSPHAYDQLPLYVSWLFKEMPINADDLLLKQ